MVAFLGAANKFHADHLTTVEEHISRAKVNIYFI